MKLQAIGHKAITAGLGVALALGALAPAAAMADSVGQTNLYVQPEQENIVTPEGSPDENIKVVLPVAINYVADTQGKLTGPSNGEVKIKNNTELGAVHISKIQVVPESGVTIVEGEEDAVADDNVYLSMRPGSKEVLSLYSFLNGKAPSAGNWDVAQQGELALNDLTGKIGGFKTLDPSVKEKIAAIHWTVASGTAEQEAETQSKLVIHLINESNSFDDLVVDKSNPSGTLPSGYSWKTASDTAVASVAEAVSAAGAEASELSLYGTTVS